VRRARLWPRPPQGSDRWGAPAGRETRPAPPVAGGRPSVGRTPGRYIFGISTLSITWMTPFEAITSGVTTRAVSTKTLPPLTLIATELP
jgi:hypothetical protein